MGPELFQILLFAARGNSIQRAGAGERFCAPYKTAAERGPRLLPVSRFSVAKCDAARRQLRRLPGWPQRRVAVRHCIAAIRREGRLAAGGEEELLDHYLNCVANYIKLDRAAFTEHYYAYVYVRIMQALGAYGFRGFYERKAHFLQSVPYALKNLRWLLHNVTLPIALPTLMGAFHSMLGSEKLQGLASSGESLTVRLFGFWFHKGWPKDETGNGGGFVFDGRSLPNPGREERFKVLTGRDAPVIEYLNQQDAVHQYPANVYSLVDASVSEYQRRGFKNLMVSFGCTGGQHRSVYLAEQVAKRLRSRGIEVVLQHRELERGLGASGA